MKKLIAVFMSKSCIPFDDEMINLFKQIRIDTTLIVAILSLLIAYYSYTLVQEQQKQIFINNISEKVSDISLKTEKVMSIFDKFNSLELEIIKNHNLKDNQDFAKNINLMDHYKMQILNHLTSIRFIYESLIVFSDNSNQEFFNNNKIREEYLIFRTQNKQLIEYMKSRIKVIIRKRNGKKIDFNKLIDRPFLKPKKYLNSILLEYLDYDKLKIVKKNNNKIMKKEKLEVIDINISHKEFISSPY